MTIWVVMGTTGEYSDRREWPVRAFKRKKEAEELITAATQKAHEIFVVGPRYRWKTDDNPFDPHMEMDYTGTSYFYYEVELV